ncbi:MAG: phage major capsid protein [Oscillospiraceae bacterium]|jgi:hypothetical protein|nr:phage major capsid protein [Oscillospiraceae bacterium]
MAYDKIKLEKGMYGVSKKSFTEVLEDLDPSKNYRGTELENLDAYQRQLKRFDIKVSGNGCDNVEKFFTASDSAVLFPEFIARAVKQGLTAHDNALSSMLTVKTIIDGIDYRALNSPVISSSLSPVSETSALPSVSVTTNNTLVALKKHGRVLSSSYEALRSQNLELFALILRKIGSYIAMEQLNDAVSILSSATTLSFQYEPPLDYSDLLRLWNVMFPFKLGAIIASSATILQILSLPEMKDATAGLDFQATGKMVTPFGASLVKSDFLDVGTILGVDREFSLQMIQSGGIKVDHDKVIDQQLEKAAVSVTAGFSNIFVNSVKKMVAES